MKYNRNVVFHEVHTFSREQLLCIFFQPKSQSTETFSNFGKTFFREFLVYILDGLGPCQTFTMVFLAINS